MVKIIADTTAGLPVKFAQDHDIPVLPQIVVFGEESFRDDSDLDTKTFLKKLRASGVMPKTAAPPPALYHPIFDKYLAQGHATLLVIAPTADASGTVRSALTAAQDYPGADIRVLDTRSVAGPLATMVILATGWAEAGLDADAILGKLERLIPRQRLYILVDTLEFLFKGGRIGGAQHLMGSLLQVKPLLALRDGRIDAHSQLRTRRKALDCLKELVRSECPRGEAGHLCVMHADAEGDAKALAAGFQAELGIADVPVFEVPPAIVVHAGPGALAVGFFVAERAQAGV